MSIMNEFKIGMDNNESLEYRFYFLNCTEEKWNRGNGCTIEIDE